VRSLVTARGLSEEVCPRSVWHLHIAACGFRRGYLGLSGAPSLPALRFKGLRGGRDPVSWAVVSTFPAESLRRD
jgi:hypothetical protein